METKLERFIRGLILAPLAPLAGLLIPWWIAYAMLPEAWIPYLAISGLLVGILLDLFLLKKALAHEINIMGWIALFLFYSICGFGFFMGVPVIIAALALPAGFIMGSRLAATKADPIRLRRTALNTAWFVTVVLALACIASAIIALISPSTASDLRGMFSLKFEVTQSMILGLIFFGGSALLAIAWVLAVASVRITYRFLHKEP